MANKTVENNFLAGGGYSVYGGTSPANPTSNIVIEGNRFGQQYYRWAASTVPSLTSPPAGRATLVGQLLGHHREGYPLP